MPSPPSLSIHLPSYIVRGRDAAHLADICQWVFDTQRVIISKDTAVQNKSGKVNTIGTESWPGRTCRRILLIHDQVLNDVFGEAGRNASPTARLCYIVWEEFMDYLWELKYGCPVDTEEHWPAYAKRLQAKAERFLETFRELAGAGNFTVYMHVLLFHVPRVVMRFGAIIKGSSQGAEALHQRIQRSTQDFSNRHEQVLGAQVLRREVMSKQAEGMMLKRKYANTELQHMHGGYMSRKERIEYDVAFTKARGACAQRYREKEFGKAQVGSTCSIM